MLIQLTTNLSTGLTLGNLPAVVCAAAIFDIVVLLTRALIGDFALKSVSERLFRPLSIRFGPKGAAPPDEAFDRIIGEAEEASE